MHIVITTKGWYNKQMKQLFNAVLGMLLFTALPIYAQDSSTNTLVLNSNAVSAAQGWLKTIAFTNQTWGSFSSIKQHIVNKKPLYYVVQLKPEGYIVVAADKRLNPVVAFSTHGTFPQEKNNPLTLLLDKDLTSRLAVLGNKTNSSIALSSSSNRWEHLESAATNEVVSSKANLSYGSQLLYDNGAIVAPITTPTDIRIAPLLQSYWGQTVDDSGTVNCFNTGTPNNDPAGCVATAMAQLMRYYSYPTGPVGVKTFTVTVGSTLQTATLMGGDGFGGPYNWGNMPLDYNYPSLSQAKAVGALIADVGASVNMVYDFDSSGADLSLAATVLPSVFQYGNAICAQQPAMTNLMAMVNPNLDAHQPVLFGIQGPIGHAVVCDGYGYMNGVIYHHLNMGWNGAADTWYGLPNIAIYTGETFSNITECVYNIFTHGIGEVISGRTLDLSGNPIQNVTVSISGGGFSGTTTSDSKGIYAFAGVPSSANFTLIASGTGVTTQTNTCTTGMSSSSSISGGNITLSGLTTPARFTGGTTSGNIWNLNFNLGPKANLAFFTSGGWSGPLVVSTNTQTTSTYITPGATTYLSFGVQNNGQLTITNGWQAQISLDGNVINSTTCPQVLNAGGQWIAQSINISTLSAGTHTISVLLDSTAQVSESTRSDNTATLSIAVLSTNLPPLFANPASGIYQIGQPITLQAPAGAAIKYQINAGLWQNYIQAISLPAGTNLLNAYYTYYDHTSDTINNSYIILTAPTNNPTTGIFPSASSIAIGTPGFPSAQLFYNLNSAGWQSYTAPIAISLPGNTIQAYYILGSTHSPTNTASYTVLTPLAFYPSAGSYGQGQTFSISNNLAQASYYQINSNGWNSYNLPVYLPSGQDVVSAYYTFNGVSSLTNTVAYSVLGAAYIQPASCTTNQAIQVTISGQQLFFSINNSAFVPYTGSFSLNGGSNGNATVTAYAGNPQNAVTNTYQFVVPTPTVTPSTLFVDQMQITCSSSVGSIYYNINTNGSVDTSTITNLYVGPLRIYSTAEIAIVATAAGYQPSQPVIADYNLVSITNSDVSHAPIIGPASGVITGATNSPTIIPVTITSLSGATNYISINGGAFSQCGALVLLALTNYDIKAYAQEPGKIGSPLVESIYTAKYPVPQVVLNADTTLTASSIYPGAFHIIAPDGSRVPWLSITATNATTIPLSQVGQYNIIEASAP